MKAWLRMTRLSERVYTIECPLQRKTHCGGFRLAGVEFGSLVGKVRRSERAHMISDTANYFYSFSRRPSGPTYDRPKPFVVFDRSFFEMPMMSLFGKHAKN